MFMYHGFYPGWFGFWGFGWPLVMVAIAVIPFWRICTRVGLSPWLSLLIIVPLANLVFLYVLAFGQWPGPCDTGAGRAGSPPAGGGPGAPTPGS